MKKRFRKQSVVVDINITPFTDVILVLLVIFMITTPLISQSNINVDLPKVQKGATEQKLPSLSAEIMVTREGMVYLNGKIVTKKELKEQVKMLHTQNSNMGVMLYSDKFVRFQEVVNVLDLLTELGINKLNIAAKAE